MNALPIDYSQVALQSGSPQPLGATWTGEGVNFAIHASGATRVELCLFDDGGERELRRIALTERTEKEREG